MPHDVRELLTTTAYRQRDMEALLDPDRATYVRFDPDLGYVPSDVVLKDGMDHSHSTYSYEPGGQRKMVNYPDRPCRINTYGDSFTQSQQVSDGETWEEKVAAHIGEPIRNFGCGGYGVYQSYRRALLVEATDIAAEYVILNIWDDDHVRNLDAARWIRSAWNQRNLPRDQTWPLHGLPWPHLRYDLDKGEFVELPGRCRTEDELRRLADPERFYEAFKDDTIVHLFTVMTGGEAPVEELEAIAEVFGVEVNLRDPDKREKDARKLQIAYGFRSTEYMLGKMRAWAEERNKKLMILLSYGQGNICNFVETGSRFDQEFVEYLDTNDVLYVDTLVKAAEDSKAYNLSCRDYLARLYIQAAGAAVFGHYSPAGNHFFAFSVKSEIVDWLDPKPPAYRE
jgi:hypothetical protein